MKNHTTFKDLHVILTDAELLQISHDIANKTLEINSIETLKKRISPLRDTVTILSQTFSDGYVTKSTECKVVFNSPTDGKKTIQRKDTLEVVEVLHMTETEIEETLQEELEFGQSDNSEKTTKDKNLKLVVPKEKQDIKRKQKKKGTQNV